MTQEEIIRMAREAGLIHKRGNLDVVQHSITQIERLAALVADAKKQELIDLCEREIQQLSIDNDEGHVSRFDEGLCAAYHTILKGLLA